MVDEAKINELMETVPDMELDFVLTQLRRAKTPFRVDQNDEWDGLEQALVEEINTAFPGALTLPSLLLREPKYGNKIVPEEVKRAYLRCLHFSYEFLGRL